jgi:hypothetical protein
MWRRRTMAPRLQRSWDRVHNTDQEVRLQADDNVLVGDLLIQGNRQILDSAGQRNKRLKVRRL